MAEPPSDRLARREPVAPVAADPAHVLGPRGREGALFSVTTTEFVDDGSGTVTLRGHTVEMRTEDGRPVFEQVPGTGWSWRVRARAAGDGLRGDRHQNSGQRLGVEVGPRGPSWPTRPGPPTSAASSCAGTKQEPSLMVWASPRAVFHGSSDEPWLMGKPAACACPGLRDALAVPRVANGVYILRADGHRRATPEHLGHGRRPAAGARVGREPPRAGVRAALPYDQPGLGRSSVPPVALRHGRLRHRRPRSIDAVGWDDCLVIGLSFGGMVSPGAGHQAHPERRTRSGCSTRGGAGRGAGTVPTWSP